MEGREKEVRRRKEERSREQRKLREFDAPFLSVNGTVIVKVAGAVASLVAGVVDVIVSIAGLPRDSQTFLFLLFAALSVRPRHTWNILCPTGQFEAEAHKEPRLLVQNQEAREQFWFTREIVTSRNGASQIINCKMAKLVQFAG